MCTYFLIILLILVYFSVIFYAVNHECYDFKTVVMHDSKNAEAMLRLFLWKNPSCEIVVLDKSTKKETHAILEKIACDISRVHIINCNYCL